jgi:4-amino-4-deoxy-L-arabinose transferase-like glycosyltransferase
VKSRRVGFLSVLFVVFFPPFLAHAHYNPKDIPLMTSVLITSFVFVQALRIQRRWLFCLTGFLLGISIALKVSALLMLPVFGLSYLISRFQNRDHRLFLREVSWMILITVMIVLGTIVAWPSAWGDPLLILHSILFFSHDFWPGKVLFFGREYTGGDLPWYYTVLEYLMTMPLVTILAFISGCVLIVQKAFRKPFDAVSLFFILWVFVPIAFSLKPNLVRYDGMRQFFFCLPAIAILAAFGFDALLRRIE